MALLGPFFHPIRWHANHDVLKDDEPGGIIDEVEKAEGARGRPVAMGR